MCLGVPGRIVAIDEAPEGLAMGTVSFGGITKAVCLACVPEARVGDYVVVHVGFALTVVDAAEAARTLELLRELGELGELHDLEAPDELNAPQPR
jgi:hydrogenase expression/formation protein HypC